MVKVNKHWYEKIVDFLLSEAIGTGCVIEKYVCVQDTADKLF